MRNSNDIAGPYSISPRGSTCHMIRSTRSSTMGFGKCELYPVEKHLPNGTMKRKAMMQQYLIRLFLFMFAKNILPLVISVNLQIFILTAFLRRHINFQKTIIH